MSAISGVVETRRAFTRTLWWAIRPLWVWRLIRLLVRSLWLAALLALAGWLLAFSNGRAFTWREWALAGAALFAGLLPLQALWPLSLRRLAGRLDRRFQLYDQLTAAYQVAERGPANYVETDLVEASAFTLNEIRRRLIFKFAIPWTDLQLAALVAAAAFAVFTWAAAHNAPPSPVIPSASYEPLPPVGLEPLVELPGIPSDAQTNRAGQIGASPDAADTAGLLEAADAQAILDALAEALSEPPITQSAAAALSQGDTEQAADELRDLAQDADSLSEGARRTLAEALRAAADSLESTAPDQAEALRDAASALEQQTSNEAARDAAAADALGDLAQMIESADGTRAQDNNREGAGAGDAGEGITQPGEGSDGNAEGAGQQAGEGESGSTGDGGGGYREEASTGSVYSLQQSAVPVPLRRGESLDPGTLRPAEDPTLAQDRRSVPYVHLEAAGAGGEQPSDPLTIPWRLRNVIQRYFSPN
jgi:hypothetical protein